MPQSPSDLFAPQLPAEKNRHIYTVSEITRDIKLILENTFAEIWVEGEVSGISRIPTGTVFFNLKDATGLLRCVIFPSYTDALKFGLKDGLRIICSGRVSVYEKQGNYQFYVQKIEPKGIGSLQLALEQLKQKLEKEGLFSAGHKRPLPYLPAKVGIVTSLSGAAIKDILKVLDRRFGDLEIIIRPAQVQGEGAKEDIAEAIKELNLFNSQVLPAEKIGVMIVGRGGGSIEDLWAFNEEVVARSIYNSKIPVISAVGHERDWTIADLVSDMRAATPSVAAELVSPKKEDLKDMLENLGRRLKKSLANVAGSFQQDIDSLCHRLIMNMGYALELNKSKFNSAKKKLALLNPAVLIGQHKQLIMGLARQIYVRTEHLLKLKQSEFNGALTNLSSLSPLNILSRGYSIVFKMPEGVIIKDSGLLKSGDLVKAKLHKGEVLSQVMEVNKNG